MTPLMVFATDSDSKVSMSFFAYDLDEARRIISMIEEASADNGINVSCLTWELSQGSRADVNRFVLACTSEDESTVLNAVASPRLNIAEKPSPATTLFPPDGPSTSGK